MVEIREEQECAEDGAWRESATSAGTVRMLRRHCSREPAPTEPDR